MNHVQRFLMLINNFQPNSHEETFGHEMIFSTIEKMQ